MSTTSTPLRYPGGKSRLARFFSYMLRMNSITDCAYVEPFAGGAGAAINLLRKEYVRTLYLNDIDYGIYSFWYTVLHHTDDICRRLAYVPLTIEEWHRQRDIVNNPQNSSVEELGFAVLFMNRTNRSGIIKGGVIGGQKQTGKWKIDARFNRLILIEKIKRIALYRERINLFCMDAHDFLTDVIMEYKQKMFIYLDPPYYEMGKALYKNHYKHNDHLSLSETLKSFNDKPWVISYDNVPQIKTFYENYQQITYGINYSAADRYTGKEIMFFSHLIKQPILEDPLSISNYA